MFPFEEDAAYVQDREDLIAVLRMRFGEISPGCIEAIYNIRQLDSLQRLILIAANSPTLKIVMEEILQESGSLRIVGERFNPIETFGKGSEQNG